MEGEEEGEGEGKGKGKRRGREEEGKGKEEEDGGGGIAFFRYCLNPSSKVVRTNGHMWPSLPSASWYRHSTSSTSAISGVVFACTWFSQSDPWHHHTWVQFRILSVPTIPPSLVLLKNRCFGETYFKEF